MVSRADRRDWGALFPAHSEMRSTLSPQVSATSLPIFLAALFDVMFSVKLDVEGRSSYRFGFDRA